MTFTHFDLLSVIKNGKCLLGSAGKEYDLDLSNMTPAERLQFQRKNIAERLGLGSQFMEDDLITDQDLSTITDDAKPLPPPAPQPEAEIDMSAMSARERNRLKRKLKEDAKKQSSQKIRAVSAPVKSNFPVPLTANTNKDLPVGFDITEQPKSEKIVIESKVQKKATSGENGAEAEENIWTGQEWPFEGLSALLAMDLFDPAWEVRHGAGMGLRDIIKVWGAKAGMFSFLAPEENQLLHHRWLEDIAVRLLFVFALDRFGDFVSDQVVAPVRETRARRHLVRCLCISTRSLCWSSRIFSSD